MLYKLKKKINWINELINNSERSLKLLEDTHSLQSLKFVTDNRPLFPLTEKAFRPFCLNFIINEIIINQRSTIVEFGIGSSTIYIARLMSMNNSQGKLYSIEHDLDWVNFIQGFLERENLSNYVTVLHCPLVKYDVNGVSTPWYDKMILEEELKTVQADMLIIDGPPAFSENLHYARYFALPFLFNKLSKNSVVILDDAHRGGEKKVLNLWQKEHNLKFKFYSNSLAVAYLGNHFISNPLEGNVR